MTFTISVPVELVEQIDQARGDTPRWEWIRRAVVERLDAEPARYKPEPAVKALGGQSNAPAARERHVTALGDHGSLLHRGTPEDLGVIHQIFVGGSYALADLDGWPGLRGFTSASGSSRRPLIVDCGANIGASAVYFATCFPAAVVVALEPERENFELLRENTAPFSNVLALNLAIASTSGSLTLYDTGRGAWGYRTGPAGEESDAIGTVEAISLGDLVADHADAVPFLLKVDIEGAQADLFSGPRDALDRFPVVIVELHDWMLPGRRTSRSFLTWHLSQRRDLLQRGENTFSLSSDLCDAQPAARA